MQVDRRPVVVLVPGMWMPWWAMGPLALRLRRGGFHVRILAYSATRHNLAVNADRLAKVVAGLRNPVIHLVGHSLGGLVILQMLDQSADARIGRIVLMGTPYRGSRLARRVCRNPLLGWCLGRSVRDGLLRHRPRWRGRGELGVVAGTRPLGVGRLLGGVPAPNDGTVTVDETRVPLTESRVLLPVSHTELLLSAAVARQVRRFLAVGAFYGPEA